MNNNIRQPSRLPNNVYASYINLDRVHMDLISPASHPFSPNQNDRGGVDPWWWSLQDRILTLPPSVTSYPGSGMQLLVFRNNLANNTNLRPRPVEQSRRRDSGLTPDEQRKAFEKLKKQIYNPIPKKIIQRLGRFYRQNDARKASGDQKIDKQVAEEDDDDDKRCVICLEDFESKEVVMVTPCNHMFHEDCILPWLKSHGRCPVCRFLFCERSGESGVSTANNNNLVNDPVTNDLIYFVTSRGRSTATIEPFWF